jgi:chromosome segregation ATPase
MRAKFDQKIRKKEQEIHELERQITELQQKVRDAKTYIQAVEDSKRLLPKDDGTEHDLEDQEDTLKPGSAMAQARDVILKAGRRLHIDEILRAMGRDVTKKTRVSLAGSIASYARNKRVFEKVGPNTFRIIGMVETPQAVVPGPPASLVLKVSNN